MTMLTTKQLYITPPIPSTPPQIPLQFVKPLSYEFRVAEVLNDEGKIETVKLQMQVWEHDEYGNGIVSHFWHDVPRVRFNKDGTILP